MKKYKYKGKVYSVVECTLEDIPSHIERVFSYWETDNVDIHAQTLLLEQAIQNNNAFKLIDEFGKTKAAIYYRHIKRQSVHSLYMWFEDKRMFIMLSDYLRSIKNLMHIYFAPHTTQFVPFEFIVEEDSIRAYHVYGTPLEIDLFSNKSNNAYLDHFIAKEIQEL